MSCSSWLSHGWAAVPPWSFSPAAVAWWAPPTTLGSLTSSHHHSKRKWMVWIKHNTNTSLKINKASAVFVGWCFSGFHARHACFQHVQTARNTEQTHVSLRTGLTAERQELLTFSRQCLWELLLILFFLLRRHLAVSQLLSNYLLLG